MRVVEMMAWRAVHGASRPAVETDGRCHVQAWPVHEPEWKREILRSQWLVDEEGWG